jgi:hypothetical protein
MTVRGFALVAFAWVLLLSGCEGERTVDNWPTYEVRGTVRSSSAVPVSAALVELWIYSEADCGPEPDPGYSSDTTDVSGRYSVQQDEPFGVLRGCLRLVAHPDTGRRSEPTAIVELPVDGVEVIDGHTVFTVDLILP